MLFGAFFFVFASVVAHHVAAAVMAAFMHIDIQGVVCRHVKEIVAVCCRERTTCLSRRLTAVKLGVQDTRYTTAEFIASFPLYVTTPATLILTPKAHLVCWVEIFGLIRDLAFCFPFLLRQL